MPTLNIPGVQNHDAHRQIAARLAALGIEPPAGVTRVRDIDTALEEVIATDPTEGLAAGITDGTLTPAKAAKALHSAAAEMAAHQFAAEVRNRLAPTLDRTARQALAADADRVLADLRPVFDAAVTAVAEGIATFGTTPPKELTRSPGLAALWERTVQAREHLRAVVAARTMLAEVGYGPATLSPVWWVNDEADLDRAPQKLEDTIAAGITVTLNSADEIARLTAARDDAAERAAAEREERKRQQRENDPMVRALDRARQRTAAHAAHHHGNDAA